MPHNITLLVKGMMTLQAVLAKIDKDLTLMEIAIPYFKDKMIREKFENFDLTQMAAFCILQLSQPSNCPLKF